MNEDYNNVSISRDNWRVLAKVLAWLLFGVIILIAMNIGYNTGRHDAIRAINNSGYEVTHVTNVNTNYYIVNKNIER